MPDTKISAMSVAGPLVGTEITVCVQGGSDTQVTLQRIADLFAGGSTGVFNIPVGGTIKFNTSALGTLLTLSDAGAITTNMQTGGSDSYTAGGLLRYQNNWGGFGPNYVVYNGGIITWSVFGGGSFSITHTGNTLTSSGFTSTSWQITGQTVGYWGGPGTPIDVETAIDRIAAVVSGGGATPIP